MEVWKWVFEHVSFPVDVATKLADFTCNQHAGEHLKMGDEDVEKRFFGSEVRPQALTLR
jgi:hypothetical protein